MATAIGGVIASGVATAAVGTAWSFEFPSIDDGLLRLADFRGKVLLVVNTASFCGFTPQYRRWRPCIGAWPRRGLRSWACPAKTSARRAGPMAK